MAELSKPSPGTTGHKKVLFVLPSLEAGGAQRVIVTLLRHLDRAHFEPHLALLEKAGPFLKDVPADVPIHDLKARRVRYVLPALVWLAWKLRPCAAFSGLFELNLAMVFAKPFLPRDVRIFLREEASPSSELAQRRRRSRLWHWLYRHGYARADKIICIADFVFDELAEQFGVPRGKMVRIFNPVDIQSVRELADANGNPYSGDGPHLVTVGRLWRQKGFDVLLDAMALVHKSIPLAELTIVGGGPLELDLKAQRDRLSLTKVVHFVGFHSNPYPYVKHADLFVLASRYEGLPLVILEALALGTPVVATDCPGGLREILAGCPIGRLVPVSDARTLGETIISSCNSCRGATRRAEDLERLLNRYRVERVVREYEDLLSL